MTQAVCIVPVAAVRKLPAHAAEMVSQLLFGECCTVTETTKDNFAKITVKADGYEGWCQLQHLTAVHAALFNEPGNMLAGEWVNEINCNGTVMHVPYGSSFTGFNAGSFVFGSQQFTVTEKPCDISLLKKDAATIQRIAFTFLNTPYLWGGRSVFGIDCSGFTQLVYKFSGIALLRDAHQQATQGNTVDFLQEAVCGDLAFFDNDAGEIIHTGILLNSNEIIHASGKVQVDTIDNGGIINRATGQRTQKLRIIKRY